MSLNRYAKRKDTTQTEIVEGLRAAGWYVLVSDTPWDLIVSKGGKVRFVEAKSPGGTLTAAQTRLLCECPDLRPVFARNSAEALVQLEAAA